jgi:peroxiredoxin
VKTSHPQQLPNGDEIRKFLNADLKYSMSATFEQKNKKFISTIPRILKKISEDFLRGFSEIMQNRGKQTKCIVGLEVPYTHA